VDASGAHVRFSPAPRDFQRKDTTPNPDPNPSSDKLQALMQRYDPSASSSGNNNDSKENT
jgi:hypothetical protein